MGNVRITADQMNQYTALKELQTKLPNPLAEAIKKNGVDIAQDIPGDGELFIHFGNPPDGVHHGWSHTLQIDQTGRILSLREQKGVSLSTPKPTFKLNTESTSQLLVKLFGKYALKKTIVSVENASDYLKAKLARYDVCNAQGSRTNPEPGPAGDGQIDHVDILTYAEKNRTTPEEVESEILEIIKGKK